MTIEYRWAADCYDRLPALAADLVQRRVAVIAANDTDSALAAKAATAAIPIVFRTGTDPVGLGLVASFNRPGGNLTGVSFFAGRLGAKRLSLLHDIAPRAAVVGMLTDSTAPTAEIQVGEVQDAARTIGLKLLVVKAGTEGEIDAAFATLAQQGAGALLVGASALFGGVRVGQIVALAAQYRMPAIYAGRVTGGLISYGADDAGSNRQVGIYTGRILKGAKPADLPVQQSIKFELVINLKTAKALGLEIPSGLLAIADEVIE